jgi:hypothetical protein
MTRKDTAEPRGVVLQRQLALVLREIAAGAGRIAKQQEIIAKFDESGHYSSEAVRKLANFAKEHALNIATRHQIMRELTELGQISPPGKHRSGKTGRRTRKVSSKHRSNTKK